MLSNYALGSCYLLCLGSCLSAVKVSEQLLRCAQSPSTDVFNVYVARRYFEDARGQWVGLSKIKTEPLMLTSPFVLRA